MKNNASQRKSNQKNRPQEQGRTNKNFKKSTRVCGDECSADTHRNI